MSYLPPHLQHLQHLRGEELKTAIQKEHHAHAVAFIVRQTDYSEDTAAERLGALKDPVKVVKEYLGLPGSDKSEPTSSKSKNQMKYGEIRKFMDAGVKQYNAQKEFNERRAKYQEHLEQQQQQQHQQQQQQQQQEKRNLEEQQSESS
jgi:hypothetical protein